MTVFKEINVQTIIEREEVWVNLIDITSHLNKAIYTLTLELAVENELQPLKDTEKYFMAGLVEGMRSVAQLFAQEGAESFIDTQVKNVEDLFKTLDIDKDL